MFTMVEYATQHVTQEYPFEIAEKGWVWDVFKNLNAKIKE